MAVKTCTYEVNLEDLKVCKNINQDLLFECIANYFFPAHPALVTPEICDYINTHYPVMGYQRSGKIEVIAGIRQLQLLALNPKMRGIKIPVNIVTCRLTNKQIRDIAFRDLALSQVIFSSGKPCDLMGLLVKGCSQPDFSMEPVIKKLNRTEIAALFDIKIQTLKYHIDKS